MTNQIARTEYTKGLRILADILELHPEIPLPYGTTDFFVHKDLVPALALRDQLTDPKIQIVDRSTDFPVKITGTAGSIPVVVYIAAKAALRSGWIPTPQPFDSRLGLDVLSPR